MKYHQVKNSNRKSSFCEILREYLCRSQVQGYKLIVQTDRPLYERILWILITIFGICLTFWLVINSYLDFLESPTVTSEDPIKTSVLELSFPAVSLCSANRISQKELIEYSKFILNATEDHIQHLGRSVNEIFENLLRMGQMYTLELYDSDFYKMELIHNVLSNIYGGNYPIYEILSKLAPNCTKLMKSCKWQGQHVSCAKIFTTRKSYMGACCAFNYKRPGVSTFRNQQNFNQTITLDKPQKVHSHGSDFGLTILIDHQLNDYAFTMNSYTGISVLIYDSYDYPDQSTSSVKEKIILPEQEVFITLHPSPMKGSRSMKTFTVNSRNCVFDDEINLVFANFYSLSECLFTCRINNILQFCGCTPPQFTNLFNSTLCMYNDMPCLNRWRINWYNFEPLLSTDFPTQFEINDLHCPECVPKCNRIKYSVDMSAANFDSQLKKRSHDPKFINLTDMSNHSIIYINFGTNKVTKYDQTASYVWYELLANLGAVGCLSLGATMVSIIEIIYFFSGKLGAIWITENVKDIDRKKAEYDFAN